MTAILERVVRRTARTLVGNEYLDSEADALAALQAAEVDRRQRLPDELRHSGHGAFLDGFSLHAGVRIHGNDREGRERLCRYAPEGRDSARQLLELGRYRAFESGRATTFGRASVGHGASSCSRTARSSSTSRVRCRGDVPRAHPIEKTRIPSRIRVPQIVEADRPRHGADPQLRAGRAGARAGRALAAAHRPWARALYRVDRGNGDALDLHPQMYTIMGCLARGFTGRSSLQMTASSTSPGVESMRMTLQMLSSAGTDQFGYGTVGVARTSDGSWWHHLPRANCLPAFCVRPNRAILKPKEPSWSHRGDCRRIRRYLPNPCACACVSARVSDEDEARSYRAWRRSKGG